MNKTVRYILYAVITAICILAIFIGVYGIIFKKQVASNETPEQNVVNSVVNTTQVKDSFKDLFTNNFFASNQRTNNVEKIIQDKDVVYSAIEFKETKENSYSIDIHIPLININNDVVSKYNETTQSTFVQEANEIMEGKRGNEYIVYDVTYTSYLNNDILSVAVMALIKQGSSAQRTVVRTYNYNIATGEDVTINDILNLRGLEKTAVNKKINDTVEKAAKDAQAVTSTGYELYERDLDSEIYDITNVTTFIQGPNGELYIIYAYGNNAFTSEMDVIQI